MQRFRVRAPELRTDGEWINTEEPLTLAGLRGRVVLLDFWTSGCVNCLHVLDELRPLEAKHPDELVVIGVHSPKFAHESTRASVAAATARYGIHHPVRSDPALTLWKQYAVRAWPTLVLIDQQGYVVAQAAGEGQVSSLEMVIDELLSTPTDSSPLSLRSRSDRPAGTLYFPAKVIELPAGRNGRDEASLLVANAGGHSLVELALDAKTVLRRIGSGERGHRDGPAADAQFAEPNGLCLLPAELALGYDVVVADTVNHVLRGVRLSDGAVIHTIDLPAELAGATTVTGPVPAVLSPWDVVWWPHLGRLVVAAAGVHLLLAVDPAAGQTEVLAGTTVEGLGDGDALDGWLAQPSGFAVQGERLWFVDAETSALRYLELAEDGAAQLHTVVGEGLFDFGHVDGPATQARLQHPLGVTLLTDGSLAVLDTYNSSVRRYDPRRATVSTIAQGLAEPSGAILLGDDLLVVESAANRLTRVPFGEAVPGTGDELVSGARLQTKRPPSQISDEVVELHVMFDAPPGRKLDDRDGPATRLSVSASPPELLLDGAGEGSALQRRLRLAPGFTEGVLHISAQAASCDDDPSIEYPACHLARQDWGVPVTLSPDGSSELELILFG
ncbi:thiol-disulfide isomerase/thioredoxin [Jatrophihabitans sp. GAS493]|uniref:thioredoxin-like domain-containing protein n=1 Tax=Jatrophihabitans sp. GAS493 TaxID=1907575 RepID=UPI000BB68E79|nr:thioredoxin-like domain-containing protein [Jatrophihabitans sp. GAS493]SOD71360.1 thiol-disulfide isomerase/thioredoxin [Jatrophihabitans sp. GAS493]